MKKRVLQFIGSFNQGGSERQAIALTRMLADDGTFEVLAATLNYEGVLTDEIEAVGLPPIPEFKLSSFYNANFARQVRKCSKYLQENKIDIVHAHDFYTNVFGMAAASLAGVKTRIASKRETGGVRSRSQKFVENIAFGRAHAVVANANAVRDHLIERGLPFHKINVIYNGLDLSRFESVGGESVLERYGLPRSDDARFITLVANLRHDVKNIPMLIRAARRVVEQMHDVHFVIAGEGPLESDLRSLAAELGVAQNVHFIGRCTDVPELVAASYACVLTSTAEGFSNSILEYMASSRPVVATSVGGASEAIIDSETGYLVASDDDEALAKRLITLLENKGLADKMGEAGRRRVCERFSAASQLSETIKLYNSLS